jgi:hypothetical protein
MPPRLQYAIDAIDAANASDPNLEAGEPAEFVYGRRMSEALAAFAPDASEVVLVDEITPAPSTAAWIAALGSRSARGAGGRARQAMVAAGGLRGRRTPPVRGYGAPQTPAASFREPQGRR